ncbi:hypothetical protein Noda2021_12420 [Candidatus Dependentiae bacterium Noda2021]|nr:hypothetical protein Noda2021_12420 [Candidatus Dependentiae bacterium Noda2021]
MNALKKITLCTFSLLLLATPLVHAAKETAVRKLNKSSLSNTIATSSKIVVVDVFATWCSPCKLMGPVFEEVSAQLGDAYEFVKVDFDEVDSCSKEFKVSSVPTILVFKDGKELGRTAGYKDAATLKAKIEELAKGAKEVTRLSQEQLNVQLLEAIQQADVDGLKKAIASGADVNAEYDQGTTPVVWALAFTGMHHEKCVEMLKVLLDAGASLEITGPANPTNQTIDQMVDMMIDNATKTLNAFKQIEGVVKEHSSKTKKVVKA